MNNSNQETVIINLSNNVVSLWSEDDESKYSELAKELQYSEELIRFLSRYQKERWAAESIDYIEKTVNPNELRIDYTTNFFSGCKNLDKYGEDYIVVKFKINLHSDEIEIIGAPVPEDRTTFEEF